jgi:hypothetical protein
MAMAKKNVDVTVENHGSLFLIDPLTEKASQWIDEHVHADAQYFGSKLVVEHHYIENLVLGMVEDGIEVA